MGYKLVRRTARLFGWLGARNQEKGDQLPTVSETDRSQTVQCPTASLPVEQFESVRCHSAEPTTQRVLLVPAATLQVLIENNLY